MRFLSYLTRFCAVPISLHTSHTSSHNVAELLVGVGVDNGKLRLFSKIDVDFLFIPRGDLFLLLVTDDGSGRIGD